MRGHRLRDSKYVAIKVWKKYRDRKHPDDHGYPIPELDSLLGLAPEGHPLHPEEVAWRKRNLGIYRKTKVFCSSWCCGNPRRHYGVPTRQEKKHIEAWLEHFPYERKKMRRRS
jgi:hypothetical protein